MTTFRKALFLFLFLPLTGIVSSCMNDVEIESNQGVVGKADGPPTVGEAKALLESFGGGLSLPDFSKNMQNEGKTRAAGQLKYSPTAVMPDWAITQIFKEDDVTILMAPLEMSTPISGIIRSSVDGKVSTESSSIYSKLLIKKNKIGQLAGFVVTYLPDHSYWEENDCDINKLGYELGGTNYSGIYMVSSLNGQLIHGAKFERGELVFRFYPNWRKDVVEEGEHQHSDSIKDDCYQVKYKLRIELFDAQHNVLTRSSGGESGNFYCSFCGKNADDCTCLIVDANYICKVCHNEIVNGRCRCCSICHNSPCRCCYSCRTYPCKCWNPGPIGPPIGPPVTPPTPPGGGGGGSGGSGGGGSTTPPNPQNPCSKCKLNPCVCCKICKNFPCTCQVPDPCSGPKCPECKKLLSIATTRSTNESCEVCKCEWWKGGHNRIIDKALDIPSSKKDIIKKAGERVDADYQAVEYSHMHAMRTSDQTKREAMEKMKKYCKEKLEKFYLTGDYDALGMALHAIMDAYSPVHRFHKWDNALIYYPPHAVESTHLFPSDANNAISEVSMIYSDLTETKEPSEIIDDWGDRFERQYPNVLD